MQNTRFHKAQTDVEADSVNYISAVGPKSGSAENKRVDVDYRNARAYDY